MTELLEKILPSKKFNGPVPYELVTDVLLKVSPDIPELRGETATKVYGFPISIENCTREFLDKFVEVPEIIELCNKLYDKDLLTEIYIHKETWEIRIKFSNRVFKRHAMSWRYELAERSIENKAGLRSHTSFFK